MTPSRSRWQALRSQALDAATFCAIYFVVDVALNRFAFSSGWTILWPLNGLSIALLIMRPRSKWLSMLIGIGFGIGLGEYVDGNGLASTVVQRLISLSEIVLSAVLLPRFVTLEAWLRQPRIFLKFAGALTFGPIVSGIAAAFYFHFSAGQTYQSAFNDWATADALGIAAIMPLALSIASPEMRALFSRRSILRTLGVLALVFAGAAIVFSVSRYPLLFLLFPALLLADSVLAFSGSAIAVVFTSFVAVYLTTKGIGPFGMWPKDLPISRDVALQIFLGFHLVALFPASIMLMERRRMAAELVDTNAQLLLLASLDGLTGIGNRRSLDQQLAMEWNRASRLQMPLAFIMIDIDHFKQFNDMYGHIAGDQCLQAVAAALRSEVQRIQDHLARFGGEEFALLLPHTDGEGSLLVAEKLRSAIVGLAVPHRGSPTGFLTVSIGCAAMTPSHTGDKRLLLESADAALYEAKRAGRDRIHLAPALTQSVTAQER